MQLLSNHGDNGYGNKYYAGTCLNNTLRANRKYTFEGYIGFSPKDKFNKIFQVPYKLTLLEIPTALLHDIQIILAKDVP